MIPLKKILCLFVLYSFLFQPFTLLASSYTERLKSTAEKYYYGIGVNKDFSKALRLYLLAAENGDTEAQYIAGGMYYKGYGTPKDLKKAFSLLYGAAVNGSSTPQSQKVLGQFFLTGKTIPQNLGEAMKWYQMSAESGDRESQSELAFLYFTGRGGEKDLQKAFFWYEKSARQGLAVSQYSLGIMYYSGSGLEKTDLVKAYGWLSLAAAQKHNGAISAMNYIKNILTAEELVKAQNYALQLFQEING